MRLFISYAHVDKPIVRDWIVSKLVAGGHDAWFDERLAAGHDWKQQLCDEIERSDALVYCMTPESVASEWCQWELAQAVDLGKPVIPVLMQARTLLHDPLKKLQYVDFSDGPTGDAVARLMGGLQNLSPAQIPPAPADPKGKPAQTVEGNEKSGMKMKPIEIIGLIIAFISMVAAILALVPRGGTAPEVSATPATPIVVALRDLDIRSGPGTTFPRLAVLSAGDHLDILGVSEDDRWYQVLLSDGNTGWVVAASSAGEVSGPLGALAVIVPTEAPTFIPTLTNMPPTSTAQTTNVQPTQAGSSIDSSTMPTVASDRAYPCDAVVDPSSPSTTLNVVRQFPNNTSTTIGSVRRGDPVRIIERSGGNDVYYRIQSSGRTLGWIAEEHLELSSNCP